MCLITDTGQVNGTMYILEKEKVVTGDLLPDGKCRLHGEIVTATRTLEYIAEEYLSGEKIEITLLLERDSLVICETASQPITNEIK
ncbi:hypothetical protein LJC13_03190 [Peptostreptococcaceae bacterium OttesenSCG-928-C18]|nr:hypothetical protein [Peptostreptococcaceae bacterium OttesenSCG-928-C18]